MKKTAKAEPFSRLLSEEEQRKRDDYEWGLHNAQVRREYAGKVVVVFRRKVLGAGASYRAAWAAARRRPDCPEKHAVAMPVVPHAGPAGTDTAE
jgi:hypothetical protein